MLTKIALSCTAVFASLALNAVSARAEGPPQYQLAYQAAANTWYTTAVAAQAPLPVSQLPAPQAPGKVMPAPQAPGKVMPAPRLQVR